MDQHELLEDEAEDLVINEYEWLCGRCFARCYVYARPHVCEDLKVTEGN